MCTWNCLRRAQINTVQDIIDNYDNLNRVRNLGQRSYNEIVEKMKPYVEVPCKIGTKVYAIATPCGGCEYNNLSLDETLKNCWSCQKREIIECEFDYDLLHEFEETVFLTRAEAEKKLEGMKK